MLLAPPRNHDERDARLETFLDGYCPYQSGTNHRRLIGTLQHLFEQYQEIEREAGHEVSLNFTFTILFELKINGSIDMQSVLAKLIAIRL